MHEYEYRARMAAGYAAKQCEAGKRMEHEVGECSGWMVMVWSPRFGHSTTCENHLELALDSGL